MGTQSVGRRPGAAARRITLTSIAIGSVLCGQSIAHAELLPDTEIKYYTVVSTTASSLNEEMIAKGPLHGPGRAYANIVAKPDYSGQLVQERTCRLEDFTVRAAFTMTLPKLGQNTRLPPRLQARWESFEKFVRQHEEGHRTIWIETMEEAESRISKLRAATCAKLQDEIDEVFQEHWSAGERRQIAYDLADQAKLVRHPLLVAAASARRKVGSALAPQPSQGRALQRVRPKVLHSR
jgi:predicted secreted Zn-dependent protease